MTILDLTNINVKLEFLIRSMAVKYILWNLSNQKSDSKNALSDNRTHGV
jgi:hypothetical protein